MSRCELVFTDEEIDRFAEKIACKLKEIDKDCGICSSDYNQEITSVLIRYHTSNSSVSKVIETKFCPNCGRRLSE